MELTEHHPALKAIAKALLAVHEVLLKELNGFEAQVLKLARSDSRVRLLMTAPGVGVIVGLTYVAAIDDPARFASSKTVGAHFGMTPKKYQSGETDITGRISKTGDKGVRAVLYEAAHIILTMPIKGSDSSQACRRTG
jgi:transposase